ncbi:MAG: TRAP transporter small permease [Firmicutes bacterium]|nr:TRAP transporter small permease [Bacillota bacterium]
MFIKHLNRGTQWLASLIFIAMFLVTLFQVVARYIFGSPFVWTEELARFMYVWVTFVGAAAVFYENEHIVVDVLVQKVSARWQKVFSICSDLLVIAFNLVLFVGGIRMMGATREAKAPSIPAITYDWVYLALPLGAAVVIIIVIARLLSPSSAQRSVHGGEA